MKRDLTHLANQKFDLLIVGAGIYGATVAWDAALRGLSVAIVDKGDFGHATSANSLKTIHGGLRYLQDADLGLVRMMINERMVLLRVAPHLVHPLPCIMPTYKKLTKSRLALTAALTINDVLCYDKNKLPDPEKRLPRGQVISREACLQILPGLGSQNFTGGAIWHDAQMHNSERLTLSFIMSAAEKGAVVANYVEAKKVLSNGGKVIGITAKDNLTENVFDIQADLIINTTGPWINQTLELTTTTPPKIPLSIAINVVVPKFIENYAAGVQSWPNDKQKNSQLLFIAPWREYSIVGTKHLPYEGHPDDYSVDDETLQTFIDDVNSAYPAAQLCRKDIKFIHWGFLPAEKNHQSNAQVKLLRRGQIIDHQQHHGLAGLISVVGVKYTSARYVAKKAVDLAVLKLGRGNKQCLTHTTALVGGTIDNFGDYLEQATRQYAHHLAPETIRHLTFNYGSTLPALLQYNNSNLDLTAPVSDTSVVTKMEVLHAVQTEMAQTLSDVVFRRTELGSAGYPGKTALQSCANIMAAELQWDTNRFHQEIDYTEAIFAQKTRPTH